MNSSAALAHLVVEELLGFGVRDAVLSPGSRSTPLALQLARAEREGLLRLHVRIDERSAGFLALGLSKQSARIVPVICTSGTAVANLMPAIVEAAYSGIAVVALTADRPQRLRHRGSNQTIDQVGFFGQQVRSARDIHADGSRGGSDSQRTAVRSTLREALGSNEFDRAPTHLNLAFDEPLVPDEFRPLVPSDPGDQSTSVLREPLEFALADVGVADVPQRGVIVVGEVVDQTTVDEVRELARSCGWPVVAEPNSNVATSPFFVPHASLLLADAKTAAGLRPDFVLTVGRFGLSRSVMGLVRSAGTHVSVWLGGKDRPDPTATASAVLCGVPRPLSQPRASGAWLEQWRTAQARMNDHLLAEVADTPSGLSVADVVWRSIDPTDILFLGPSRTVRNFEAVMVGRAEAPLVIGNRGTSGIDGLVSSAWGIASAQQAANPTARTVAVMGDLSVLHDRNGLIVPSDEPRPNLLLVVVDNDGGGIFSSLEQAAAEFAADFERVFGTPHGRDLATLVDGAGAPVQIVDSLTALQRTIEEPTVGVRIVVVRTDRDFEQDQWTRVLS